MMNFIKTNTYIKMARITTKREDTKMMIFKPVEREKQTMTTLKRKHLQRWKYRNPNFHFKILVPLIMQQT